MKNKTKTICGVLAMALIIGGCARDDEWDDNRVPQHNGTRIGTVRPGNSNAFMWYMLGRSSAANPTRPYYSSWTGQNTFKGSFVSKSGASLGAFPAGSAKGASIGFASTSGFGG